MTTLEPRAESLIHDEIADLEAYLRGLPGGLAQSPAFAGYRHRLAALRDEQRLARLIGDMPSGDVVEARLSRRIDPHDAALPAATVGAFLRHWQSIFDALGQRASGKPTKRGLITKDVLHETRLLVHAHAPGSFAIRMSLQPPQTQDLLGRLSWGAEAYRLFQRLVSAGEDFDALSAVARDIQVRAASAYDRLLELLRAEELDLVAAARIGSEGRLQLVELGAEKATRIKSTLERVKTVQRDRLTVDGRLSGANLRTGSFEIDVGDEGVITGKVDADNLSILKGRPLGREYTFDLEETTEHRPTTDELTVMVTLKDILER